MDQLEIRFTPRIGRCEACSHSGVLNARICRRCESSYGRRNAELLARARREPDFARACYLEMGPSERVEFLDLLSRASGDHRSPTPASTSQQNTSALATGPTADRDAAASQSGNSHQVGVDPQLLRGFGPSLAKCRAVGPARLRLVGTASPGDQRG